MVVRKVKHIYNKYKPRRGEKITATQVLALGGLGLLALAAVGFVTLVLMIIVLSISLPNVHDLDKLTDAQSTTIYDREGNVLYVKHGGENRQYVAYDKMSQSIIDATVAIEDDNYWNHPGFDPIGIMRAFVNNLTGGSQQGGSTITQQYIKNAFLSSERTYTRKLKELILAVQLEQAYDKEQILELYLNKIPYGNNAYGTEKAAQIYFDKHALDLTLAESALLASLPKAPSYYNPYGENKFSNLTKPFSEDELRWRTIRTETDLHPNEISRGLIGQQVTIDDDSSIYIQGRSDLVLKAMLKNDLITEKEKDDALFTIQEIEFKEYRESISHPHFVFHVLSQVEEKYGQEIVEQGGLKIYTTIDPRLQSIAETAVEEGAARNEERYNAKNAALVSIDPKTGEILAMVGSKDYFSEDIDGAVNITTQYRQPGSSFKPFVYAQAFYSRYAPGSIIFDAETRFGASAFPKNYDGNFMGPMPIRKALGLSRNIPAIKAYYLAGGQEPIIELSEKMGIEFLNKDIDFGWPLALGTAEVRPLDIVSGFGVFANNGVRHEPVSILKIENADGETLEEWQAEEDGEEVLDPQIAYLINNILSDTSVRIGENLTISGKVNAAKTGTSNRKLSANDYRPHDLWTIGYTPSLVAGVWAGNNKAEDGNLTALAEGYSAAGPIWKQYMTEALAEVPSEDFPVPEGIKQVTVASASGLLPGPNTPEDQQVLEVFASFSVPTDVDNSYLTAEVDTRNGQLSNKYCPDDFVENKSFVNFQPIADYEEWKIGIDKWVETALEDGVEGINFGPNAVIAMPPTKESDLCREEYLDAKPEVRIVSPRDGKQFEKGSRFDVEIKVDSEGKVDWVEYYMDGSFQYKTADSPYTGKIRLPLGELSGEHKILVKVYNIFGYNGEDTITIKTDSKTSSTDSFSDWKEAEEEEELEEELDAIIEEIIEESDPTTLEEELSPDLRATI
ncbi:penicillin-binding protein [Pseudomonadota bacterium]